MLRAIEPRQKTIADGLAAAEEGKRSLGLASRTSDEEIRKARAARRRGAVAGEKRAAQLIEEAKNAAKEEGNREKAAAKAEIEQEMTRARAAARPGGLARGRRRREDPAARSRRQGARRAARVAEAAALMAEPSTVAVPTPGGVRPRASKRARSPSGRRMLAALRSSPPTSACARRSPTRT